MSTNAAMHAVDVVAGALGGTRRRWRPAWLCALLALLFSGCTPESAPAPELETVLDTRQLMDWIIDPGADVVWGAAGTITTADGVEDLAPTTQEGWDAVRNAAAVLAEAGTLLQLPGQSRGADWDEIAAGLTGTAKLLIDAAEQRDDQQVFDYGGQLYNVCVACHQRYLLPAAE